MSTVLIPGVCQGCGCDNEHACPGGCSWVDEYHTLCSRCAGEEDDEDDADGDIAGRLSW